MNSIDRAANNLFIVWFPQHRAK